MTLPLGQGVDGGMGLCDKFNALMVKMVGEELVADAEV